MIPAHFIEELGFHLGLGFARGLRLDTAGEQPVRPRMRKPRRVVVVEARPLMAELLSAVPDAEGYEEPPIGCGTFAPDSGAEPPAEAPTPPHVPSGGGPKSWEDLRPKHQLIGVRRAGQPSRPVATPAAPELAGRFVGSCTARCQHTGKKCDLPASHQGPHRHGRTEFTKSAVEGQTYFPGAAALEAMATSRPDAIVGESDRRTRPEEKVEVRDWKRRCVVCRKEFTERGPHPKKHCCGQKCAFVVIRSGLDQASYARREGVSPNAEVPDVAG